MNFLRRAFLPVLLCMAVSCFAQINFEPGYFIDNTGTKTEALIKNVAWKNNPVSFDYKTNAGDKALTATKEDYVEFSVGSAIFRRFTVKLDRSRDDYSWMSVNPEPEFETETLYLKVLCEGDAILYKYESENLIRFFVSKNGNEPEQLIYKPYRDGAQIGYNNSFRGQLYKVLRDKMPDTQRLKKTPYKEDKLLKLFREYNGVTEVKEQSDSKSDFNLRITPGISMVTSDNENRDTEANIKSPSKTTFRIGIEAEWVLPINKNKWSVFLEPNYESYKYTTSKTYKEGLDRETNIWKSTYNRIDVPLGVRHYMYVTDQFKFFANAGLVYSFVTGKSTADFTYQSEFMEYTRNAKASASTNLFAGGGAAFKNISLEVRYNFNRDIFASYSFWSSKVSSISIIAGYKLF